MEDKLKETVASELKNTLESMARNKYVNLPEVEILLHRVERMLLDKLLPTDSFIEELNQPANSEAVYFLSKIINPGQRWNKDALSLWPIHDPVVKALINFKGLTDNGTFSYAIKKYVASCFAETEDENKMASVLHEKGWSDAAIVSAVCDVTTNPFYKHFPQKSRRNNEAVTEKMISPFGRYLLPLLPSKKGFLGLTKEHGLIVLADSFYKEVYASDKRLYWVSFLADFYPEGLENEIEYLKKKNYNGDYIDYTILHALIERNPGKYEKLTLQVIDEHNPLKEVRYSLYLHLEATFPGKYHEKITEIGQSHLTYFKSTPQKGHYRYDPETTHGPLLQAYIDYLWKRDAAAAPTQLIKFIDDAVFLADDFLPFIEKKLGEASVSPLLFALFKDPDYIITSPRDYYQRILSLLEKYELLSYIDKLIDFGVTLADKKSKIQLAEILSRYAEKIIPLATSLLTDKTVDQRVLGALILSNIMTAEVKTSLDEAVDRETNDDIRDIILESLQEQRFATPFNDNEVAEMITHADTRKKLAKWSEKYVIEENLAPIYWKSSGKQLNEKEVRFIFYRMKRSRGMNSDVEARQVLLLLDPSRTSAFAKQLVTAFQESNADSKLKYYLTLGGLLGDDDMMHNLHMLFKKSIADKRAKMAEYVIGALAMIGSDKALRIVESIYRKFANKKPAISLAAQEALTAAASEQNTTMEELGDRIIPNFDFDGLYKTITIEGELYRAFISTDFKIHFFNEDNKLRKSLPSNAPRELKAEIKDIEKEINDVVKTQPGRLEKCMLDERRWSEEQWNTFFFNHPIMFVYSTRLLWGMYDINNKLVTVFYCTPNAELLDVNDEEITLDESMRIGIIHPIQLTGEQLDAWKDKLYHASITTLFAILDRPVFSPTEEELEQSKSKRFFERPVPRGADFVNTFMVKQNWHKTSGDGGRSEFTKTFNANLRAYANIEGPAAYYQENTAKATVFEIFFQGKGWGDKVVVKDVPPIFFSEVLADIDLLLKA